MEFLSNQYQAIRSVHVNEQQVDRRKDDERAEAILSELNLSNSTLSVSAQGKLQQRPDSS